MHKSPIKISFLIAMSGTAVLASQSSLANCQVGDHCVCKPSELQFASPTMQPNPDGQYAISLEADNVEAQGEEKVILSGNAEVQQGRQTIVADRLEYFRDTDRVKASGSVEIISQSGDYISSDSIDVIAPSQIGSLINSEFKLAQSLTSKDGIDTVKISSRGSAGVLNLEGEGVISLEKASYTTCPEGHDAVMVKAGHIELDKNAGVGVARNATIRFYGVPIAYTPYISFPINDERKTGLLTPSFGSDEESGTIVELPWYWNIAKNQDATITPKYYSERGVQLTGEYRHQSLTSSTLVYAEYLPNDSLTEDENGNAENRTLLSIDHYQKFTDNLTGSIDYNDVSDSSYFDDLSNDVSRFSDTYVPQDIALAYNSKYFSVQARGSQFQIVDSEVSEFRRPYDRLPQVTFSTHLPSGPWNIDYGINGSYTDFVFDADTSGLTDEEAANLLRVEGTRTSLNPYLSVPFENLWGYVKPKVTLHNRSYSLNNVDEGQDDNPSFSVPIFSIDAGIALEKNTTWFGKNALHTLEPRIFYVYAPEEDQSGIPDFDTSAVSLNNFNGIYRESRFYGEDRVGDTNQVTIGLTSQITDSETGDRRFAASIGQLYLIDDLEQNLNENTVIESGLGDLLAQFELSTNDDWTVSGFAQYGHEDSEIRTVRLSVNYQPLEDQRKRVNLDYYLSKGATRTTDQAVLSANWPITNRWSFFGSERYSLEDSDSLATTVGFVYDGCCWKFRATAAENSRDGGLDDKRTSYFFELELSSLGSFGGALL